MPQPSRIRPTARIKPKSELRQIVDHLQGVIGGEGRHGAAAQQGYGHYQRAVAAETLFHLSGHGEPLRFLLLFRIFLFLQFNEFLFQLLLREKNETMFRRVLTILFHCLLQQLLVKADRHDAVGILTVPVWFRPAVCGKFDIGMLEDVILEVPNGPLPRTKRSAYWLSSIRTSSGMSSSRPVSCQLVE